MNDELVEWLRAQIDWQEDIARRARDADEAADRLFVGHCSPNWTLREVEAKRRILHEHREHPMAPEGFCRTCGGTQGPCMTKRLIALPYADRPGYQEDWRP